MTRYRISSKTSDFLNKSDVCHSNQYKIYKINFLFLFIISVLFQPYISTIAQDDFWLTYYEKSNYLETPRYDETIEYCKKLDGASEKIYFTSFGVSAQRRQLPLLIIDKNSNFTVDKIKQSGNTIVLIQACIHAGECDGKDAGLMLIRDIVIDGQLKELLDNVTILFIPILNVDGHERFGPYNRINQNGPKEMGWRTNAQNLNLNRDYLKADTPEIQAWLRIFNQWFPDFFIDCHVTDGADYQYAMSYGLEILGNMSENLTKWQKNILLKQLSERMEKSGFAMAPYVEFRNAHDPNSGLMSWVAPPFLSEGYTAIQNRPGLLLEAHSLKDYKTRVSATFEALKHTLSILNENAAELKQYVKETDEYCASKDFRMKKYILTYQPTNDSIMVDFLGYEYDTVKSEISGGTWFKYTDKKKTFNIPYFNKQIPDETVQLPEAYIIPPEWKEVIERLKIHGIYHEYLDNDTIIKVKTYKFRNVKWREKPYEGRFTVDFDYDEIEVEKYYPEHSFIIPMNQRASQVIAQILEPKGYDSYIHWGLFNAIFEQKEYAESYVMERIAREMLAGDETSPLAPSQEGESLRKEFEFKKSDSTFADNPRNILNWFYSKSPYLDKNINVYPVGRIFDKNFLKEQYEKN